MASPLLFRNASVLTMDPHLPRAGAALVEGDQITWVGADGDAPHDRAQRVIDCGGATLLPGLNDAHIHLLAYATSLRHLDCGRDSVSSIAVLQRLLDVQTRATPPGRWMRGRGYDEFYLFERRHPTRHDLDPVTPEHPVRLDHRSGHACVLNSRGLQEVGITADTPDPVDGVIQRDESGEPTGVLLEMGRYVSQRMRETRDESALQQSVVEASNQLLRWGVTSLQDATPGNDLKQWETFSRLLHAGVLHQRLSVMPGIRHLHRFMEKGLRAWSGAHYLRVGPAKIVVTFTTGTLHPPTEELRELVLQAHRSGSPVAIHAVEEEAILAAVRALLDDPCTRGEAGHRDRIEHCSEATPQVVELLRQARATVVTQPGFVYESGERYRAEVARERQEWLYPLNALWQAGIPLGTGSDAPVASPDPWPGVYAAVTRRDLAGGVLHPEHRLSVEDALSLWTRGAAYASGEEQTKGTLRPGMLADLALLDRDVTKVDFEDLLKCRATMTVIGGEVVWEG